MINLDDEILPDFRASCTKQEAVAKMLGWMRGPIRRKYIQVTENGISADQLPFLHSLEGSLEAQLMELREAAIQALSKSADAGASEEALQEQADAVLDCEELMKKAASYLIDIEDEIAKNKSSALRIDRRATKKTGVTYITLKSLDQWARKEYGISIIEPLPAVPATEHSPERPKHQEKNESAPTDGLSRTQKENLYTTFAFLIEAFVEISKNPRYGKADRLNVQNIAEHLASLATKANNPNFLRGQSAEAIKDRIEEAMRIKRSKLPGTAQ